MTAPKTMNNILTIAKSRYRINWGRRRVCAKWERRWCWWWQSASIAGHKIGANSQVAICWGMNQTIWERRRNCSVRSEISSFLWPLFLGLTQRIVLLCLFFSVVPPLLPFLMLRIYLGECLPVCAAKQGTHRIIVCFHSLSHWTAACPFQ